MDNLIVASLSQQQHNDNVQKLLDVLHRSKFTLNHAKTIKPVSVINVLGYRVGGRIIGTDPYCLQSIKDMPVLQRPKEQERVLGMVAYYSKWIPCFAGQALPLRSSSFPLDTSACNAVESLKQLEKQHFLPSTKHDLMWSNVMHLNLPFLPPSTNGKGQSLSCPKTSKEVSVTTHRWKRKRSPLIKRFINGSIFCYVSHSQSSQINVPLHSCWDIIPSLRLKTIKSKASGWNCHR